MVALGRREWHAYHGAPASASPHWAARKPSGAVHPGPSCRRDCVTGEHRSCSWPIDASHEVPYYKRLCEHAWRATQVAWQTLTDASASLVSKASPCAAAGAILTSQRLLVVSPELRILVASPSGVAITSCLWLGPGLLYSTSGHQVDDISKPRKVTWRKELANALLWLGMLARCCKHRSLPSVSPLYTGYAAALGRGICQDLQLCCGSAGSAARRSCRQACLA